MNPLIPVNHRRQQWSVGHGFFHTAKIVVDGLTYRYVYDCGSRNNSTLANKRVDEYWRVETLNDNNDPDIEMLVVSHFHDDHINGIQQLFSRFNIKKLVLPYLAQNSKIVALAQLAASGTSTWIELHKLVIEPQEWLKNNGGENTKLVQISDEGGETIEEQAATENVNELSFGFSSILNHKSTPAIYKSGKPIWRFLFYCQNHSTASNNIIAKLKKDLNLSSDKDLLDQLSNQSWIAAHHNKIKSCYVSIFSKQNPTSLCMFSGPHYNYHLYDARTSNLSWLRHRHWYRREVIGWLGTGDAELKDPAAFLAFNKHFGKIIAQVLTVSIPHHGSIGNYHPGLGQIGFQHVITSNHKIHSHHPSPLVIAHIQTECGNPIVVTKDDDSTLFERFDLGC